MKQNKQEHSNYAMNEIRKHIYTIKNTKERNKLLDCLLTLTLDYGELTLYRNVIDKGLYKKGRKV